MNRYSTPVRMNKKVFIYDRDDAVVCWVQKINKDTSDWEKKHFGTINDTWLIIDSVGLGRDNWRNRETREMYLQQWCDEIEEECSFLF